jgi:hypothetical protein
MSQKMFSVAYNAHVKRAKQQGFRPMGPTLFSVLTQQLCFM